MKKLLAFTVFVFVSIFTFASPAKATSCAITSESISPSSAALSAGSTGVTWTVSASCQSPYIHNTANALGYLCNGGSCVAATATPVRNSYTYTFSFLLNQSSPAGVWTPRMTLSSSDGVTKFDIGSNSSVVVSAHVAPTTTTTIAPTTTTTVAPTVCVKSTSGQQIYDTVTWFYSPSSGPSNPAYKSMSLAVWQSMTHEQKINSGPLYMTPAPTGGCNQLYSYPPATTTTTIPPPVTTTSTVPVATVTTVAPTTTTTLPRWRNYCQPYNAYTWHQATLDSLYYTYPPSAVYPVPTGGCSSLNKVQTTNTTSAPVVQQKTQVAPTQVAILPKVQSPVITSPVIQSPVATLPKTVTPGVSAAVPAKAPYVAPWKYVYKQKTSTKQIETGALCYSGKISTATGSGACSHNGGVKKLIYHSTKSTSKVKYKCWLNKNTNTYNKNCIAV